MQRPARTRAKATKAGKSKARSTKTAKAKAKPSEDVRRRKAANSDEPDKPARKSARSSTRSSTAAKKSGKKASRKTKPTKARTSSKSPRASKSSAEVDRTPNLELLSSEASEPQVPTVPPRRLTSRRARTLLDLESALSERIVGKAETIEKVSRVVRVRMTQLDFRPERPNGSFLLVGPSGVGKNEFAYALSEVLFGSEDRVVSIDLGEFDDEDDLAKLGPSPVPGVEGHLFEGILTSPVRKDPHAILLLRGIERAHPAFQRLLAQILDSGTVEDMLGEVDFRHTIIFVTHHVSRDDSTPGEIGFSRPSKSAEALRREQLELYVLPDLLDAFNEVIEMPPLSAGQVRQIARYKVKKVLDRMERRKRAITVSESVYDELISDDLCRADGANFLNRTLEERLFNPLARYMLTHQKDRQITIGVDHGRIVIS